MIKIVNENGILWAVERQYISGIWHEHRKYIGKEEKPIANEEIEEPKENKKNKKKEEK